LVILEIYNMENENMATMPQEQGEEQITMPKMNGWYLAMGIFLVIAGVAALVSPIATTLVTNVFIGWFLIFGGIVQFFAAIVNKKENGVWIGMLMSILAFILGLMMINNPIASLVSITLMLGIFFGVDGIVKTFHSITRRPIHWGWMLTSGLVSLLLSAMILMNLFASSAIMLGIFAGIYMLFAGVDIIILYSVSKK